MANSWRRERWDSLRLLTPNWQSRLPGVRYDGPDPDGYMTSAEVVELIDRFAARARAPRPDRHERHLGAARRRRLPRHDEPRRDPVARRGPRQRRLQPAERAGLCARGAAGRRAADAVRLPRSGPAPRRRRARRRGVGDRRAAGGRAAAIGPAGDPLGRGARAVAADLSRPRCPVVDGRVWRVGPALRRDRRSQAGAAAAVAAARRDARASDARSQRAGGDRRRAGGPLGGRP